MFAEVKDSLPVSGDGYDAQIIREIKACALDLTTSAEIILPGDIDITRTHEAATTSEPEHWTITDNSTVTDELIITVISIWCNMRIGNPPNYDQLLAAYNSLKGQLRLSKTYTNPETDPGTDPEENQEGGADDADADEL